MLSLTHTAIASAATGTDSGSPIIEAPGSCQHFKYWLSKPAQSRSVHNKQVMLGVGRHLCILCCKVPSESVSTVVILPSFLLFQKLSLQCSCRVSPLFQDPFIPMALFLLGADSSSDSPLLLSPLLQHF